MQSMPLSQSIESDLQSFSGDSKEASSEQQDNTSSNTSTDDVQSLSVANDATDPAHEGSELPQGTDSPVATSAPASAITADAIAMPSAEMLASIGSGVGIDGQAIAQANQVVGQVLADALAGGGANQIDIDAALSQLPSHGGATGALDALASQNGSGVPSWNSGGMTAFAGANDMLSVDAVMLHPDAAPAAA
jgi:hypothetical protein